VVGTAEAEAEAGEGLGKLQDALEGVLQRTDVEELVQGRIAPVLALRYSLSVGMGLLLLFEIGRDAGHAPGCFC
jgi:hypothetical protein